MSRGAIRRRSVPCLRGVDPEVRAMRYRAARKYGWGTIARIAILMGHWDHGSIVKGGSDGNQEKPGAE